jgi:hypothetical protein
VWVSPCDGTTADHDAESWVWVITLFRVITQTQLTCMLAEQTHALPATIRQRLAEESDVY